MNFNWACFGIYESEYRRGNYAIVEGQPHSQLMGNGGFTFSVGELNFICEGNFDQTRKIKVDPYIENEEQYLKVYYYDDEMFDVPNQQYMVVRIDAFLEAQG